jgi:uncharacterized membrane protein YfcA
MDPMLITAGALTGLLVGLTGVGGGALMTPLLLLFFGVTPLAAVGTDLWFAAITKLFATRVHHGHGLIDWPAVRRLWLGSLTASALTLVWMKLHPVDAAAVTLLKTAIAAAVLVTALGMLFQKTQTFGHPLCHPLRAGPHARRGHRPGAHRPCRGLRAPVLSRRGGPLRLLRLPGGGTLLRLERLPGGRHWTFGHPLCHPQLGHPMDFWTPTLSSPTWSSLLVV